jgi:pimeloyl-ACP methyl ester carboxylesterase
VTKAEFKRIGNTGVTVVSPAQGTARGSVVLVHGVCMSGQIWHHWAQRLAQRGLEAWCLDLRGRGSNSGTVNLGKVRIEDYVDDVERTLEIANSQAVIGHDMGGLICQVVASRRDLRGMVLVGTFAPKGISGRSHITLLWRELRPKYIKALMRGAEWKPEDADVIHMLCDKVPEEERQHILHLVQSESGTAAREMSVGGIAVDEAKIHCPSLVVASTFDRFTPPSRQRLVASRYRSDYVEFAQHGHLPMLEPGFERPIAVIGRWLEEAARVGDTKGSVARISLRRKDREKKTPEPQAIEDEALGCRIYHFCAQFL